MPITNKNYAKYYESHKEVINEKLRNKYEGGGNEKKKNYYNANKEEIKEKVIRRYQDRKAQNNENRLRELLNQNIPQDTIDKINLLLSGDDYRTMRKREIDLLEEEIIQE
jgi:hypothetical protein